VVRRAERRTRRPDYYDGAFNEQFDALIIQFCMFSKLKLNLNPTDGLHNLEQLANILEETNQNLVVLVDEYDHYANSLLSIRNSSITDDFYKRAHMPLRGIFTTLKAIPLAKAITCGLLLAVTIMLMILRSLMS